MTANDIAHSPKHRLVAFVSNDQTRIKATYAVSPNVISTEVIAATSLALFSSRRGINSVRIYWVHAITADSRMVSPNSFGNAIGAGVLSLKYQRPALIRCSFL